MPLGFDFGLDAFGFGFALVLLLADPRGPGFAVGGIAAGEGDGEDVGVGDDEWIVLALDEDFDAGRVRLGVAVEDVAFDGTVGESKSHVATIVERLVDGLDAVGIGTELEGGAFERSGLGARMGLNFSRHTLGAHGGLGRLDESRP